MDVPEEPKGGFPLRRLLVGLALIALGGAWLADVAGASVPWRTILPVALMVVGLLLILGTGPEGNGVLFAVGLVLIVIIMSTSSTVEEQRPLTSTHRISTLSQLEEPIEVAAGRVSIDMTSLRVRRRADFEASVTAGRLIVTLPPNLPVKVNAEMGSGNVEIFGEERRGISFEEIYVDEAFERARARLELDLRVNVGQLIVAR